MKPFQFDLKLVNTCCCWYFDCQNETSYRESLRTAVFDDAAGDMYVIYDYLLVVGLIYKALRCLPATPAETKAQPREVHVTNACMHMRLVMGTIKHRHRKSLACMEQRQWVCCPGQSSGPFPSFNEYLSAALFRRSSTNLVACLLDLVVCSLTCMVMNFQIRSCMQC